MAPLNERSEMNGNSSNGISSSAGTSSQHEDQNSHVNGTTNINDDFHFSDLNLEDVRKMHCDFSTKRNWNQFHSPRNILLALVGEVGEVAEHFQWRSDAECQIGLPNWTPEQRNGLGEELADVFIYLTRLADRSQIDLSKAVLDKMAKNEKKYPVEKAFGSSKKYNEL